MIEGGRKWQQQAPVLCQKVKSRAAELSQNTAMMEWVECQHLPGNHPCDGVYLVPTINYDPRLDNDPIKVIKVITAHQVHSWQPQAEEGI